MSRWQTLTVALTAGGTLAAMSGCGPTAGTGSTTTPSAQTTSSPASSPTSIATTPSPTAASRWVFSDPLSAASASNLREEGSFSGATGSARYTAGAYRVTDGSSAFEIFETPQVPHSLGDTDVEVDVNVQQAGPHDSVGVLCRATGSGATAAFYALYYSSNYFLIIDDAPGNQRVLAKIPNTQFPSLTGSGHIGAQCTGSNPVQLALFVNGTQVVTATDSTSTALTAGDAGIFVRNDSADTEVVDFTNLDIG